MTKRIWLKRLVAYLLLPAGLCALSRLAVAQNELPNNALQKPAAAVKVVDYIWVDTVPSGATVEINEETKGKTPFFINHLKAGTYRLRFTLDGYVPQERTLNIPNSGEAQRITLRLADDACLIESKPPWASVLSGAQLLGRTPLILRQWPAGTYDFRVVRHGYEGKTVRVTIEQGHPSRTRVELQPITGTLRITTMPAGARVFVDRTPKGESIRIDKQTNRSVPMVLTGMLPGERKIQIEYRGVKSESKKIILAKKGEADVLMMLWYPDTRVTLVSGSVLTGMLVQKNATGDIVLARSLTDHRRILKNRIKKMEALTAGETTKLLLQHRLHIQKEKR